MKNIFNRICSLWTLAVILVCGIFSACNPENNKTFSVTFKEAGPGYATVTATVPGPTEVAYAIQEEAMENTSANLVFMFGTKATFNADGDQQLLADIKENTVYHLYLVARLSASSYSEVYHFEFDSGAFEFSELCTVVAVTGDGYKMHISVPESVKSSTPGKAGSRAIRFNQADLMFYNLQRQTYDEYWMLLHNSQRYVTADETIVYSDEENRTQASEDLNEDGVVDENDETYRWSPISPGEPVVFIAGEFEWMQIPSEYDNGGEKQEENYTVDGWVYPAGWPAGYYLPMMDGSRYDEYYGLNSGTKGVNIIEDIDLTEDIDEFWTGAFQRKLFRTRVPDKLDGGVDMEIVALGPVDGTLAFTPSENVLFYCVAILDDGTYKEMLKLLDGHEEYLQWATASYFAMYNFGTRQFYEATDVVLSEHFYDVPADTKYHVLVTGMGDEAGLTQSFNHYEFSTPAKTKDFGPTIEVEALEDQSGPFTASFRVKCTTPENPVMKCYYGANYVKDWIYAINGGGTYLSYGQQAAFTADEVAQINSDEGLVVSFPSIDGETTRLVVVGYNDENTPNDVSSYEDITECPAVAELTTPYNEVDVCGAYYEMASELAGDWTMTATVLDADGNKQTATKNVSILSEYTDFPSELPESVYDIYYEHTKWTKEEIDGYWNDFKNNVKTFNTKRLEGQNRLALVGWIDGGVYGAYETMMPYDLFISETVNTVDVKSMFSDFGPKLYIDVAEDESGKPKLSITADMVFGSPVMYWSDPFYMAARSEAEANNTVFYYADPVTGYYKSPLVFDVECSEDYQILTIKALEANGSKWYPNVIGQDSQTGRYLLDYPIVSEVVLTKGVAAEETALKAVKNVSVSPVGEPLNISHKKYTRFGKPAPKAKMEVMTQEKAHANYEKYIRLMENKSNR